MLFDRHNEWARLKFTAVRLFDDDDVDETSFNNNNCSDALLVVNDLAGERISNGDETPGES